MSIRRNRKNRQSKGRQRKNGRSSTARHRRSASPQPRRPVLVAIPDSMEPLHGVNAIDAELVNEIGQFQSDFLDHAFGTGRAAAQLVSDLTRHPNIILRYAPDASAVHLYVINERQVFLDYADHEQLVAGLIVVLPLFKNGRIKGRRDIRRHVDRVAHCGIDTEVFGEGMDGSEAEQQKAHIRKEAEPKLVPAHRLNTSDDAPRLVVEAAALVALQMEDDGYADSTIRSFISKARGLSSCEPVLEQVGPEDIRLRLSRSTSPAVQRDLHRTFWQFFQTLIDLGWWLASNPCDPVDPTTIPPAAQRTTMFGPAWVQDAA